MTIIKGFVFEVTGVELKSGEKNGKPWTKWGVKMGDSWYGTFDSVMAKAADDFQQSGLEVEMYETIACFCWRPSSGAPGTAHVPSSRRKRVASLVTGATPRSSASSQARATGRP